MVEETLRTAFETAKDNKKGKKAFTVFCLFVRFVFVAAVALLYFGGDGLLFYFSSFTTQPGMQN